MTESPRTWSPHRAEHTVGGTTVVTLHGDIDLLAVPALNARLDRLTAVGRPDLVIDLSAVDFIDCSGIGVLCRAWKRALARHGRLRLVCDSPRFLRILRQVRLDDVFDVRPRLADALGGAAPR
ncbi:STAS domain-containing protein [Streptomyces sp. enrichment culture]|uniref:STAS domain-containing protein n=1 Tax=Streptomyces sp. enrichment culture TaxID=1795815 RepID=UPI003F573723